MKTRRENDTGKFWIFEASNPIYPGRVIDKRAEGVRFATVEGT